MFNIFKKLLRKKQNRLEPAARFEIALSPLSFGAPEKNTVIHLPDASTFPEALNSIVPPDEPTVLPDPVLPSPLREPVSGITAKTNLRIIGDEPTDSMKEFGPFLNRPSIIRDYDNCKAVTSAVKHPVAYYFEADGTPRKIHFTELQNDNRFLFARDQHLFTDPSKTVRLQVRNGKSDRDGSELGKRHFWTPPGTCRTEAFPEGNAFTCTYSSALEHSHYWAGML